MLNRIAIVVVAAALGSAAIATDAVSTVLVGMRRPANVEDATAMLGWPPLANVRPVYEAIRSLRLAES